MGHRARMRIIMVFLTMTIMFNHKEDFVMAYKRTVSKAEISAILNRDLESYHEKKLQHDGK